MVATKEKPVIDTQKDYDKEVKVAKGHQITQEKQQEAARNKGSTNHLENNGQNGNSKFLTVSNYFKDKSIKFSNPNTQNGWIALKKQITKFSDLLPTKDSL